MFHVKQNPDALRTASPYVLLTIIVVLITVMSLHGGDHTEAYTALGGIATALISRFFTFGAAPPAPTDGDQK